MGTRKTLAQLQAEADERYGNYEIEISEDCVVVLLPVLRLPDDKHDKVRELLRKINTMQEAASAEQTDESADGKASGTATLRATVHEFFRTVAKTKKPVDELLKRCGDDLGLLLVLIEDFSEASQAGEASSSPS